MQKIGRLSQFINSIWALVTGVITLDSLSDVTGFPEGEIALLSALQAENRSSDVPAVEGLVAAGGYDYEPFDDPYE